MNKPGPRHRALPALYGAIYPTMADVGLEHGYVMALHGSMARDMDVIAVPWVEKPSDDGTLAEAVARALGAVAGDDIVVVPPEAGGIKPHGRRVWSIVLDGGAFIDLSVFAPTTGGEQ